MGAPCFWCRSPGRKKAKTAALWTTKNMCKLCGFDWASLLSYESAPRISSGAPRIYQLRLSAILRTFLCIKIYVFVQSLCLHPCKLSNSSFPARCLSLGVSGHIQCIVENFSKNRNALILFNGNLSACFSNGLIQSDGSELPQTSRKLLQNL